jgi:hypothetical protein
MSKEYSWISNAEIVSKEYNFTGHCQKEPSKEYILEAIAKRKFYTTSGVISYFFNKCAKKDIAKEIFEAQFFALTESNMLFWRWPDMEILVRSFLDSNVSDINVVINCLKHMSNEQDLPTNSRYLTNIIVRHRKCNAAAIKYLLIFADPQTKKFASKHRLAKKILPFV